MKKLMMVCSLAFAAAACAAQLSLVEPAENAVVPLITEGQKAFMDMPEAARRFLPWNLAESSGRN